MIFPVPAKCNRTHATATLLDKVSSEARKNIASLARGSTASIRRGPKGFSENGFRYLIVAIPCVNFLLLPIIGGGTLQSCCIRPPGIYGEEERRHFDRVLVS